MKYIKQFAIIIAISCMGELFHFLLPFPVPASIYGMVIMLALLMGKRLKVEDVKETASFLIEIMPMMFIPAAVGLMTSWDMISSRLLPYTVVTVVSLVCVMVATGHAAQFVIRKGKKK